MSCEMRAVIGGITVFEAAIRATEPTSSKMVYAKFSRLPLGCMWLQQSLAYLDQLQQMGEHRLYYIFRFTYGDGHRFQGDARLPVPFCCVKRPNSIMQMQSSF